MLLVDTNIFVAAADTSTPEHARCAALLDEHTDLVVPTPVAIETAWMIESRLGVDAEAVRRIRREQGARSHRPHRRRLVPLPGDADQKVGVRESLRARRRRRP